ncbi:MAG: thioredoxin domain-containing protein, partial [Acidimicrobiales bacterium]
PGELSPYLRQHIDNPVDWYTWSDDAFARATELDRPIFLSVGYSACHWCHVMAHESFEDPVVAARLNVAFVSIKVDREERPDVDAVYMEAVQSITGSGGWPMSVFLTPDGRPFYGGTYFPPHDLQGRPSFTTVLGALVDIWDNRRGEVEEQADELAAAIASRSLIETGPDATSPLAGIGGTVPDLLSPTVAELSRRFDASWGGFGAAPKFPQPTLVDVALRQALRLGDTPTGADALAMATRTLDAMAAGGIHDHLGGGFARYATDHEWLVPHFEKMLYDQAGLLRAYLHGWQVTGNPDYLAVVEGIVSYVTRDLTAAAGGIYSAEDADSEGVEGKFYVWTPEQVAQAMETGPDAARTAAAVGTWFDVTPSGNFEGATILRRPVGAALSDPGLVESGRARLLAVRSLRVRPGLDDKVLTEWNAMYASALAEAAAATGNEAWAASAIAIGEFLCANMIDAGGRWLRSWQPESGARHLAYAADHAWLVDCFTRLGELTGKAVWMTRATTAGDALIDRFADTEGGGFFTTADDAERLIVRTKDVFDGATPSANAVAAYALARLGALTGERRYTDQARRAIDLIGALLTRHPTAFAHSVLTADLLARGGTEIVITGDRPDLLVEVRRQWRPDAVLAWGEPTDSPLWEGRDVDRAYVCRDYACRMPADAVATLAGQLADTT